MKGSADQEEVTQARAALPALWREIAIGTQEGRIRSAARIRRQEAYPNVTDEHWQPPIITQGEVGGQRRHLPKMANARVTRRNKK